jgi:hypothetical protein
MPAHAAGHRPASVNARVLIDGPSERIFDDALPDAVEVLPGSRTRVPQARMAATCTVPVQGVDVCDSVELRQGWRSFAVCGEAPFALLSPNGTSLRLVLVLRSPPRPRR